MSANVEIAMEDGELLCVICYDKIGIQNSDGQKETPMQLECQHVFGNVCLDKWLAQKRKCPICRGVVRGYGEADSDSDSGSDGMDGLDTVSDSDLDSGVEADSDEDMDDDSDDEISDSEDDGEVWPGLLPSIQSRPGTPHPDFVDSGDEESNGEGSESEDSQIDVDDSDNGSDTETEHEGDDDHDDGHHGIVIHPNDDLRVHIPDATQVDTQFHDVFSGPMSAFGNAIRTAQRMHMGVNWTEVDSDS